MIAAGHYLVKILLASPQLLGLVLVRIHVGGGVFTLLICCDRAISLF